MGNTYILKFVFERVIFWYYDAQYHGKGLQCILASCDNGKFELRTIMVVTLASSAADVIEKGTTCLLFISTQFPLRESVTLHVQQGK